MPGSFTPLAPRVVGSKKLVGAHVSAAGGVSNAIKNAVMIGANSFAIFLKNQRRWDSKPLESSEIEAFKTQCRLHGYDPQRDVLPHGSYLINLGNGNKEKREKAYGAFLDDLKRCEQLGIKYYNLHPGAAVDGATRKDAIKNIADGINRAHEATTSVVVVLENMAGQGNTIGNKFEELGAIIKQVTDKERVGVCLDTCHAFAAGYDLRTKEKFDATIKELETHVGLQYLKGVHINDSKEGLNCNKDRHEFLGKGKIGAEAFKFLMNDERFNGIPMILETPIKEEKEWVPEIKMLYEMEERKDNTEDVKEEDK
ncbi:endonuclease IV [Ramicandelaber brevisporus]|nr:endonuclease IV [Ramicandelaber brevisporus]